jgi:hypothetical protein
MTMPNFLIIGAEKAGTTALYHLLSHHPQIYMSAVKEPSFFAFENHIMDYVGPGDRWINNTARTELANYQDLFNDRIDEKAVGEASTYYMMLSTKSARTIAHYVPEMKIILILRNPIERAYSAFISMISYGREHMRDFTLALDAGKHRWFDHWEPAWRYYENSLYAPKMLAYLSYFPHSQIRIYLYEDWKSKPLSVLTDIFGFLEVSADYIPDSLNQYNVSNYPRNDMLFQFLTAPNMLKTLIKPFLSKQTRQTLKKAIISRNWMAPPQLDDKTRLKLIEKFRSDVLSLQEILDRDLSSWLRV